jgi:hypothetical protein
MARAVRLILCIAAGLWLVFVARTSRDVEVEPSVPRAPIPMLPRAIADRPLRPAITLDEGAAGEEMRRLRDHWQRAVLLR